MIIVQIFATMKKIWNLLSFCKLYLNTVSFNVYIRHGEIFFSGTNFGAYMMVTHLFVLPKGMSFYFTYFSSIREKWSISHFHILGLSMLKIIYRSVLCKFFTSTRNFVLILTALFSVTFRLVAVPGKAAAFKPPRQGWRDNSVVLSSWGLELRF